MRTSQSIVALAAVAAALTGCSEPGTSEMASAGEVDPAVLAAVLPAMPGEGETHEHSSASETEMVAAEEEAEPEAASPRDDLDLFSPPKVVVPPVTETQEEPTESESQAETETEPRKEEQELPLPPLRLLGFVEVEQPKALLEVDGELNVVAVGDEVSGLEILAVETPKLVVRHGKREFDLDLFEQQWTRRPQSRGPARGSRKTFGRKTARPVSSGPDELRKKPSLPDLADEQPAFKAPKLPRLPGTKDLETRLPRLPNLGEDALNALPKLLDRRDGSAGPTSND